MQLKNRLKKIEQTLAEAQPQQPFCDCEKNRVMAQINRAYHGTSINESDFSLSEGDYCERCRKPVDPVWRSVVAKINKLYGDFDPAA